jgi:uncharacterized protein YycO
MPTLSWRCVNGAGFVAGAINFVSRGAVCHVEFLVDGKAIGAHSDGGVQIREIDACPVDYRFSASCTDEQYQKAIDFLHGQIGKPYDFLDIVGIMANRDWHNPERWICSELWAATMEAAGIMGRLPTALQLVTPQDALVISAAMFGKY